jgi:hypothetical protein
VITGKPAPTVVAGNSFRFAPKAFDADGDALEFAISNRPAWAGFDTRTGRLQGTPRPADIGAYDGVRISVSDGHASSALASFTITVQPVGRGSVTLTWTAPTQNTDGSPLRDLAGYRILYGRSRNDLDQTLELDNPGITTAVVENLGSGKWNFAVRAVNRAGRESDLSNISAKALP